MRDGSCFIIGAGDLTVGSIPCHEDTDYVIAADGGLMYCGILGIEPNLVVGDFDSLDEELNSTVEELERTAPEKIKRLPVEKDDTDMAAAIKEGLALGYRRFYMYGACGGRLEHTLANIQLMKYLKNRGAEGFLCDGNGMSLLVQDEEIALKETLEGYINIFCMGDSAQGVTLKNLKYELEDVDLSDDFPLGISNEFIGKSASISVKQGTLLVMIDWVE
ncbi:MAG: thiamine diphosphokinase [Lachnospiraceae bacterium]|nr:thiamine diphosphokinase [Lachnospiraceae bacterium]